MEISQIRTITVMVSDQELAKQFYVGTLGFHVRTDLTMGENRWLEVVPPGGGSGMVLHKPFPGMAAGSAQGTVLETSDIEADVAALRDDGVNVDGPREMPWGREATFADPDGNGYVLSAPRTGS